MLDFQKLEAQIEEVVEAKVRPQVAEPNRGPYKLVAHRFTDSGAIKSFPINSRTHPTLADVQAKTTDGRRLCGYWYDVYDRDGVHIATLKDATWTFEPEPVRVCRICQEGYRGYGQLCERCEHETAQHGIVANGCDATMSHLWR